MENGPLVEHFMGSLPLKKGNAKSLYSTFIDWLKKKSVQCRKLVGMGFDGAAMFGRKKSAVQARLKKNALHAIFIVIGFSWQLFKLQIVLRGWSSIAPQRDVKDSRRCRKYYTTPSWLAHVKRCCDVIVTTLQNNL